ncbi:DUF397 domain-containing protein [Streptomyces tirandamycinicus]|uniref:DUF397 domain-containing protein n=1 Tax=Streptomyces tirandamycinicus TaxID=2174846 RepID=UPI002D1E3FDF|nr:DUF397 domain-containing protein [Streptomyces tirandamycinicus]
MSNLYSLPVQGTQFQNFCGGNLQGEHESCVEVGQIPGSVSSYVLRDNKPEGAAVSFASPRWNWTTSPVGGPPSGV